VRLHYVECFLKSSQQVLCIFCRLAMASEPGDPRLLFDNARLRLGDVPYGLFKIDLGVLHPAIMSKSMRVSKTQCGDRRLKTAVRSAGRSPASFYSGPASFAGPRWMLSAIC
jgi:hypothetical protein